MTMYIQCFLSVLIGKKKGSSTYIYMYLCFLAGGPSSVSSLAAAAAGTLFSFSVRVDTHIK